MAPRIETKTLTGGVSDGVEVVTLDNGTLRVDVLPTRGLGLHRARCGNLDLGWQSPVQGPVHPKFVNQEARNGLGWLEGFDELLARCGLASNGPPGDDGGQRLTLHGRVANLPARKVSHQIDGDTLRLTGEVEEGGLFFGRLKLTATYETKAHSNVLTIRDTLENLGGQPAEYQMLYHLNLGPPLLGAGSKLVLPFRELAPFTPRAAEGIATWDTCLGPTAGYAEQVYAAVPLADAAGKTLALLHTADKSAGLLVRWSVAELPCFTFWKNTAALADGYVVGLEPGTNYPNFRAAERKHGRVPKLPPGGRWQATWSFEALPTAAGVTAALDEIDRVQKTAPGVLHQTPQAKFAPKPP